MSFPTTPTITHPPSIKELRDTFLCFEMKIRKNRVEPEIPDNGIKIENTKHVTETGAIFL